MMNTTSRHIPMTILIFQACALAWTNSIYGVWGFAISVCAWLGNELLIKMEPMTPEDKLLLEDTCETLTSQCSLIQLLEKSLKDNEIRVKDLESKLETVQKTLAIKRMGI